MTSPFVRIVVVHHDSRATAVACLRALARTEWDQFEIVLVDNGSDGTVAELVASELPSVRVVRSATNRGFVGGNNLALTDLDDVDLVALVNDDVTVEPGWLRPLVDTLDTDEGLGAAGPKILLEDRYSALTIETPVTTAGGGDRRLLGVHLSDARCDGESVWSRLRLRGGWWGPEPVTGSTTWGEWTAARAEVLVPVPRSVTSTPTTSTPTRVELALSASSERKIMLRSGSAAAAVVVTTTPTWYEVSLTGDPFDVINNAGTVLVDDAYGADRGYLEADHGQYDREEDVFSWCGAAVVLRASYLRDVGVFDEALFLYCEDLDLAWRGLEHGWRHRYVPTSVVRHRHGASAGRLPAEHLALLKERNHLVVTARRARPAVVRRAVAGFLVATAAYARRDIISPLVRGERPRPAIPLTRAPARSPRSRGPSWTGCSPTCCEHGEARNLPFCWVSARIATFGHSERVRLGGSVTVRSSTCSADPMFFGAGRSAIATVTTDPDVFPHCKDAPMPRLVRHRAALVALVVTVLTFGAIGCAPRGTHQESWAQVMLAQVNAHRANHGVPPLGWCPALGRAAQAHSGFQAAINTMTHTGGGPGSFSLGERANGAGYRHWSGLGENVARTGGGDVARVMANWMNSSGHRGNILSASYEHFGAGAANGPSGTFWTQDFGRSGSC